MTSPVGADQNTLSATAPTRCMESGTSGTRLAPSGPCRVRRVQSGTFVGTRHVNATAIRRYEIRTTPVGYPFLPGRVSGASGTPKGDTRKSTRPDHPRESTRIRIHGESESVPASPVRAREARVGRLPPRFAGPGWGTARIPAQSRHSPWGRVVLQRPTATLRILNPPRMACSEAECVT